MKKQNLKSKKTNYKKTAGITLIALVVTIIVLLILAGISIMMLSGNNGILNRAGEAKEITGEKQIGERVHLAYLASLTGGKGQATEELLRKELDNEFGKDGYELSEDLTKVTIDSKDYEIGGNVVKRPKEKITKDKNGTTIAKKDGITEPWLPTSKAEILNNNIDTGLTIKDEAGNEWVWVEVPRDDTTVYPNAGLSIEKFTDEECTAIAKDLATYSGSDLPSIAENETFAKHIPLVGDGVPDYTSAYKDVLKSIYQNGGFYVGRYETGIQGTENETTSVRTQKGDATQLAVIKENVQPYTYVTWEQAQTLAQEISAGKKGDKTSSLLMGVQWDLVLKFLGKNGEINNSSWGNYRDAEFDIEQGMYLIYKNNGLDITWKSGDTENYVSNGKKIKNTGYSDNKGVILITTGANTKNNSINNICDIAGNVEEWTIEKTSNNDFPCSCRGGDYENMGLYGPAIYHSDAITAFSAGKNRLSCLTLLTFDKYKIYGKMLKKRLRCI